MDISGSIARGMGASPTLFPKDGGLLEGLFLEVVYSAMTSPIVG